MNNHGMFTADFWKTATQRAVRTFAQTAIAAVGVGTTNILTVDLKNVLALSISAAVLSLLMSIDRSSEPGTHTLAEPAIVEVDVQPSVPEFPPVETFHGFGGSLR